MQGMSFPDSSIDVIIHSDTLEHVPDSKPALKESLARPETGRPFVLYCANRYWAIDPDTVCLPVITENRERTGTIA